MDDRVESIPDRLAPAKGTAVSMGVVIAVFLIVDTFVVVALVSALAPHALLWVILLCIGSPLLAFWLIQMLGWRPWQRSFPAKPQHTDAVVRLNQSFQLGAWMRLNNCLHIAADDEHLHLIPFCVLRWVGAGVISLPWIAVTDVKATRWKSMMRGRVDGRTISGPSWCLALATPIEPESTSEDD